MGIPKTKKDKNKTGIILYYIILYEGGGGGKANPFEAATIAVGGQRGRDDED